MNFLLALLLGALFAIANTAYILRLGTGAASRPWAVFAHQFMAASVALLVFLATTR